MQSGLGIRRYSSILVEYGLQVSKLVSSTVTSDLSDTFMGNKCRRINQSPLY